MAKRRRRKFDAAFKADAVRLCRNGDKNISQVAKELDLTESALREWVRRAEVDDSKSPAGELTTAERSELQELRRRVTRLEMVREILKKAAAFFAKESE
jgi:transposase-like protein